MAIDRYCAEKGCPGGNGCVNKSTLRGTGGCVFEYVASKYAPEHRWQGDGPPPRKWMAGNTLVYRSYADYCD